MLGTKLNCWMTSYCWNSWIYFPVTQFLWRHFQCYGPSPQSSQNFANCCLWHPDIIFIVIVKHCYWPRTYFAISHLLKFQENQNLPISKIFNAPYMLCLKFYISKIVISSKCYCYSSTIHFCQNLQDRSIPILYTRLDQHCKQNLCYISTNWRHMFIKIGTTTNLANCYCYVILSNSTSFM